MLLNIIRVSLFPQLIMHASRQGTNKPACSAIAKPWAAPVGPGLHARACALAPHKVQRKAGRREARGVLVVARELQQALQDLVRMPKRLCLLPILEPAA